MSNHKKSRRFHGDNFDCTILEQSVDRDYIELREEYFINQYDTFNSGLNNSYNGKGLQTGFTTKGFIYSEQSRELMSQKAKQRAAREGVEIRSARSKANWQDDQYREKQVKARKGKRLRPLKVSDEVVAEIRSLYEKERLVIQQELDCINEERSKINAGWKPLQVHSEFAKKYCEHYGVSKNFIVGVVLWKTRTKVLPSSHKKN